MKITCPTNDGSGNPCNTQLKQTEIFGVSGSRKRFQRYTCPKCKYQTCRSLAAEANDIRVNGGKA